LKYPLLIPLPRVFNNPNCHSEEEKRPKNLGQGKLREESETLTLNEVKGDS